MRLAHYHTTTKENEVKISLVAAYEKNYGIGKNNKLLWRLPSDMEWFKLITIGKPIIMGKNTFLSIGKALPGRTNIVLTRDPNFEAEDILVASSVEEAIHLAGESVEVLIIGGGSVYETFIDMADTLYITHVGADLEADTFFLDGRRIIISDEYTATTESMTMIMNTTWFLPSTIGIKNEQPTPNKQT